MNRNDTYDVLFCHPPTSFAKIRYPLSGIFESATGTSDLLTMAPVGLFSMGNELKGRVSVGVLNVAKLYERQRAGEEIDALETALSVEARLYGVSLHWAAHTPGALELVRQLKRRRPECAVILGGLTATCWSRELLAEVPEIDAVVLGECDGLIHRIVEGVLEGRRWGDIPNIAYRGDDGDYRESSASPPDLACVDYYPYPELMVHQAPERADSRESVMGILPLLRGCYHDCLFCGGSRRAYSTHFGRARPRYLEVEQVLRYVANCCTHGKTSVKLAGDTRGNGGAWDRSLELGIKAISDEFYLFGELFDLADHDYLRRWRRKTRFLSYTLSPESTSQQVRRHHGKRFTNQSLVEQLRAAEDLDVHLLLCFTYVMPGQSRSQVLGELEEIERLARESSNLALMYQPYLFIDPGSALFDQPQRFGYTIHLDHPRVLERALSRPYWFYSIGYETPDLTRRGFHEVILDVTERKSRLHYRLGNITGGELLETQENVLLNRRLGARIGDRFDTVSDEDLAQLIDDVFPPHLLRSNASLLRRRFMGNALADEPRTPHQLLYQALPGLCELLALQAKKPLGLVERWVAFREMHADALASELKQPTTPELLITHARELNATLPVPLGDELLMEVLRFDWLVYQAGRLDDELLGRLDLRYPVPRLHRYADLAKVENGKLVLREDRCSVTVEAGEVIVDISGRRYRLNRLHRRLYRQHPQLLSLLHELLRQPKEPMLIPV